MIRQVLFIGGSADGKRESIDSPLEVIDIQVMKDCFARWNENVERPPVKIESYYRVSTPYRIGDCYAYLFQSESEKNLIPLLINGYRREK
jgi:hypothetical protein